MSSVLKKMFEVSKKIGTVAKSGNNTHHKYKYAKEADIIEAIKPLLLEQGLFISMEVEDCELDEDKVTTIKAVFKVTDVESGDSEAFSTFGQGYDATDKGVYKAMTGAQKYFFTKNFLIPTGDDPEKDTKSASAGSATNRPAKKTSSRKSRTTKAEEPAENTEGETPPIRKASRLRTRARK